MMPRSGQMRCLLPYSLKGQMRMAAGGEGEMERGARDRCGEKGEEDGKGESKGRAGEGRERRAKGGRYAGKTSRGGWDEKRRGRRGGKERAGSENAGGKRGAGTLKSCGGERRTQPRGPVRLQVLLLLLAVHGCVKAENRVGHLKRSARTARTNGSLSLSRALFQSNSLRPLLSPAVYLSPPSYHPY